ncbi:MAG: glycosyltransferase family 4 protein [bacterium]|nr:glycosyltransferase family 4 protein [bacterium]
MKVLMVIGQFYPVVGGAERQCQKLSMLLRARGHECTVLTTRPDRTVPSHEEIDGIPVERVGYPVVRIGSVRIGFGCFAPFIFGMVLFNRIKNYDIVHAHQGLWPAAVSAVVARLRRKPLVCKIGNSGPLFDLTKLRTGHWYGTIAAWMLIRWCNRFIWTSRAVYDDLSSSGVTEEKMASIPNGVVVPEALERDHHNRLFTVLFVGTFTPKKNVTALVEAAALLLRSHGESFRVVLAGDGPERKHLEVLIAERGLQNSVSITGYISDVASLYRTSDVFVLPSLTEGLSNAALEAMAWGLLVILSERGGNKDLICNARMSNGMSLGENGIFVDPDDPSSIARALTYCIENKDILWRMGNRSRSFVVEQYSFDRIVQRYESLYATLA